MADRVSNRSQGNVRRTSLRLGSSLKGQPGVFLALLLVIWVGLPLVPESTGLRFGVGYRSFLTVMVLLSGLLFRLLEVDRVPVPRSTTGVMGSLGRGVPCDDGNPCPGRVGLPSIRSAGASGGCRTGCSRARRGAVLEQRRRVFPLPRHLGQGGNARTRPHLCGLSRRGTGAGARG